MNLCATADCSRGNVVARGVQTLATMRAVVANTRNVVAVATEFFFLLLLRLYIISPGAKREGYG
jgi:hypothetical protein